MERINIPNQHIMPRKKCIKLSPAQCTHSDVNFWLSNIYILGHHGWLPILLVDLLAEIWRGQEKDVQLNQAQHNFWKYLTHKCWIIF
jgi:hypothetical protein